MFLCSAGGREAREGLWGQGWRVQVCELGPADGRFLGCGWQQWSPVVGSEHSMGVSPPLWAVAVAPGQGAGWVLEGSVW